MNALRQQILAMSPARYARAAKRAARLAVDLAEKSGREVSLSTRYLAESSEEDLAAERARTMGATMTERINQIDKMLFDASVEVLCVRKKSDREKADRMITDARIELRKLQGKQ